MYKLNGKMLMLKLKIVVAALCISLLTSCINSPDKSEENTSHNPTDVIKKNVDATVLGRKLTTGDGMTLYTYDPNKGAICSDGCTVWPPYGYARNDAPSVLATEKKMVLRYFDELKVWTINGNPLHTYSGDKKPGDIESDGVGGWYIAREPMSDK